MERLGQYHNCFSYSILSTRGAFSPLVCLSRRRGETRSFALRWDFHSNNLKNLGLRSDSLVRLVKQVSPRKNNSSSFERRERYPPTKTMNRCSTPVSIKIRKLSSSVEQVLYSHESLDIVYSCFVLTLAQILTQPLFLTLALDA